MSRTVGLTRPPVWTQNIGNCTYRNIMALTWMEYLPATFRCNDTSDSSPLSSLQLVGLLPFLLWRGSRISLRLNARHALSGCIYKNIVREGES